MVYRRHDRDSVAAPVHADGIKRDRIVHGDCLQILNASQDEVIDTTFLDWPYTQSSPVRGKDDGAASRVFGPISFLVRVLQALYRVTKPGSHMYLFSDWKSIPDIGYAMSTAGWFPKTIIVWDKCYVGTGGFWRSSWDPIFFASKGPATKRTDNAFPNVIRVPSVRHGRSHPYQKPEALWDALCKVSVVQGSCVLDPFAGSGSSREPTERAGGIWYGIDIDPRFTEVRRNR